MPIPVRRVVTGLNAQGRSCVVSDGPAEVKSENPNWPGNGTLSFWKTGEMPVNNLVEVTPTTFPGPDGSTFIMVRMQPESQLETMPAEQVARIRKPPASRTPDAHSKEDGRKHHAMHYTNTIDYIVMLSGEVTLMLDEGEVVLKPFDVLVQRGIHHGWANRGKEPALFACVVIDAVPVYGDKKG